MSASLPILCPILPAVLAVLTSTGVVTANWITIKNDTGKAIVVQETTAAKGPVKRAKPVNLLEGETFREFVPGPTVKRVDVFDAKNPTQPLWSGNLSCKDENQTFSVTVTGGKVTVTPVAIPPKK